MLLCSLSRKHLIAFMGSAAVYITRAAFLEADENEKHHLVKALLPQNLKNCFCKPRLSKSALLHSGVFSGVDKCQKGSVSPLSAHKSSRACKYMIKSSVVDCK